MASSTPCDSDMRPPKRRRTESFASNATQPREVGIMRQDGGRGASFVGSASGIHFVRSVYKAVGDASPGATESLRQETVPGEEDQLPHAASNGDSERLWKISEVVQPVSGYIVTFEDMVRWSQSYFDHWHPMLPFLHAPVFLDWCEIISQRPLEASRNRLTPHQRIIVRAVLSTGLMDRRQMGSSALDAVPLPLVFGSFHDAVTSVQAALVSAPSLESLQAALSVQLFLISMLRHNAASRIGGVIVRLVFQMGIHRCPYRYSAFPQQDCILRQRVFWSIYCLDRYICQSLGIPLTLRDDDIDVCMLDNEQHVRDGDADYVMDSRLTLLCLCAKHSRIKGRVLELCNKSINHRHLDMGEVAQTRTMIAKWANEVEDSLESGTPCGDLHQLTLSVLKDESTIALNRPLLTGDERDQGYESALQACIASSRSIIKSIAHHAGHTPLIWPSFTWAAWMGGFVVLYATTKGELPPIAASSLVNQCANALDRLSTRGTIWPNTCAKVIRDLAASVPQSSNILKSDAPSRQEPEATNDSYSNAEAPAPSHQTPSICPDDLSGNGMPHDSLSNFFDQGPDSIDLFRGFDIPFWLGDDQYGGIMENGWMQ